MPASSTARRSRARAGERQCAGEDRAARSATGRRGRRSPRPRRSRSAPRATGAPSRPTRSGSAASSPRRCSITRLATASPAAPTTPAAAPERRQGRGTISAAAPGAIAARRRTRTAARAGPRATPGRRCSQPAHRCRSQAACRARPPRPARRARAGAEHAEVRLAARPGPRRPLTVEIQEPMLIGDVVLNTRSMLRKRVGPPRSEIRTTGLTAMPASVGGPARARASGCRSAARRMPDRRTRPPGRP